MQSAAAQAHPSAINLLPKAATNPVVSSDATGNWNAFYDHLGVSGVSDGNSSIATRLDRVTQGNWTGKYGADGYILCDSFGSTNYPEDSQGNVSNLPYCTYNDPQAIGYGGHYSWAPYGQNGLTLPDGTAPVASCWYNGGASGTPLKTNLTFTKAFTGRLSFYLLSIAGNRSETVSININGLNYQIQDVPNTADLANGIYVSFVIKVNAGDVINIVISADVVGNSNAVLSGIFLDSLQFNGNNSISMNRIPAGYTGIQYYNNPEFPVVVPGHQYTFMSWWKQDPTCAETDIAYNYQGIQWCQNNTGVSTIGTTVALSRNKWTLMVSQGVCPAGMNGVLLFWYTGGYVSNIPTGDLWYCAQPGFFDGNVPPGLWVPGAGSALTAPRAS